MFQRILSGITGVGLVVVVGGLVTGMIPPPKHALADSSRIVSLYYDGQKKVITTDAPTVGAVLAEAGVNLSKGDSVEPAASVKIPAGFFNINVYRSRPVMVIDGQRRITIETTSQSPAFIAKAAGLTVFPEDTYTTETISNIADAGTVGQSVTIHRAVPVVVVSDGQQQIFRTQQKTVGAVLDEHDVALGPQDTVTQDRAAAVAPNMVIEVMRIKLVVVKENHAIPYETQSIPDNTLTIGTNRVEAEGYDGQKVLTYRINYQNGIEQHRDLLATEVLSQPTTKVVHVGTKIDYSADPVELGRQMAAQYGWTDDQWTALYKLWTNESNWNPSARNFWSGACGIPQAYPCNKITDKSTAGQIKWGLSYISDKYGTPASAWAYWQRNGSY